MHELSLAVEILELVDRAAQDSGFHHVHVLRLEVGQLSGVETQALRFALENLAPGSRIDGARIAIDEPKGQAWCSPCQKTVPLGLRGDPCPHCGGHELRITGGQGFRVIDLEVSDLGDSS